MQLTTDIKPRRDGKLTAKVDDGTEYKFEDDGSGRLVADIKDENHVAFLLDTGNFYPLDEAAELETDEDESDEGGEGGQDAAPIESNTPPKPKATPKPKAAKAKKAE